MLKKLKSVLKSPKGSVLPLALKAAIFSGLLYLSAVYNWLFIVVFLAVAFHFYFRPSLNSGQFLYSFLALIVISLISFNSSLEIGNWKLEISLLFGLLFFLLLGVKNLIFSHRQQFYYFFHGLLLSIILIFFFHSDKFNLFFIKYILVFFAVFALIKEFLNFSVPEASNNRKKNLIAVSGAFLAVEFAWLINLLPSGFLNAASLLLLMILILEDLIVHHFSGTITRQIILRDVTAFLVLGLVILGASNWSL